MKNIHILFEYMSSDERRLVFLKSCVWVVLKSNIEFIRILHGYLTVTFLIIWMVCTFILLSGLFASVKDSMACFIELEFSWSFTFQSFLPSFLSGTLFYCFCLAFMKLSDVYGFIVFLLRSDHDTQLLILWQVQWQGQETQAEVNIQINLPYLCGCLVWKGFKWD